MTKIVTLERITDPAVWCEREGGVAVGASRFTWRCPANEDPRLLSYLPTGMEVLRWFNTVACRESAHTHRFPDEALWELVLSLEKRIASLEDSRRSLAGVAEDVSAFLKPSHPASSGTEQE